MVSIRKFLVTVVTATILMCSGAAISQSLGPAPTGCEPDELFLSLSSDETWRANMALNFATKNLELGYPVTVFLNVEAVRLAVQNKRYPQDTYGLTGKTAQEVLKSLSEKGGRVIVCPSCLERAGFRDQQLISEVYLGGPVPDIFQCSSKQLSY